MTFDITIFGGLGAYYAIYNALASIFNNTGFVNSMIMVALMISLIATVGQAAFESGTGGRMSVSLAHLGILVLLALALTGPKVTMNITDKYPPPLDASGLNALTYNNVRVVDNVPMVAALPAYLANKVSDGISDKLCTVLSTVNGQYTCDSTSQFLALPKILLAPMTAQSKGLDPMAQNFANYMSECLTADQLSSVKTAANNQAALYSSTVFDPVANANISYDGFLYNAVLQMSPSPGYMTWFTPKTGNNGVSVSSSNCFNAKSDLQAAMPLAVSPNVLRNGGAPNNTSESEYVAKVNEVYGSAVNAQSFYTQSLLWAATQYASECGSNAGDSSAYTTCVRGLGGQLFYYAMEGANDYSFVKTTLPESISYMQGIFIALVPLFMFFALASGSRGLKTFITSFIFFVWINTWYPTALVVDFAATAYVQDALANTHNAPWPAVFMTLQKISGLSGVMMSAVFLLTFAVMTGNAMAMSSIAGKLSPGDTESGAKLAGFKSEMEVEPQVRMGAAYSGDRHQGFAGAGAAQRDHAQSAALTASTASASSEAASARQSETAAVGKSAAFVTKASNGYQQSDDVTRGVIGAHSQATDDATQNALDFANKQGHTIKNMDSFRNDFGAEVGLGIPGIAGVKQAYKKATGVDLTDDQAKAFTDKYSSSINSKVGDQKTWQAQVSHALKNYNGVDHSTASGLSADIKQSSERVKSADNKFEQAVRAQEDLKSSFNMNDAQVGANIANNGTAQTALTQGVANALRDDSTRQKYNEALARNQRRLDSPLLKNLNNKDMIAQLSALEDIGATKDVLSVYSALSGMTGGPSGDPLRNKGVSGDVDSRVPQHPSQSNPDKTLSNLRRNGMPVMHDNATPAHGEATPAPSGTTGHTPVAAPAKSANHKPATSSTPPKAAPRAPQAKLSDDEKLEREMHKHGDPTTAWKDKVDSVPAKQENDRQAIAEGKRDVQEAPTKLTREQVKGLMNFDNAKDMGAAAGDKWEDFSNEHPILAAALETAVTAAIPGGAVLKGFRMAGAARSALGAVKTAAKAADAAKAELNALKAIRTTQSRGLLGNSVKYDAKAMAERGFTGPDAIQKYEKAVETAVKKATDAESKVMSHGQAFATELGGSGTKSALSAVGAEVKGAAQIAAPGVALQFSKSQYAQSVQHEQADRARLLKDIHADAQGATNFEIGGSGGAPAMGGSGHAQPFGGQNQLHRDSVVARKSLFDTNASGVLPFQKK